MEFKLNKIDLALRQKINDRTKDGKVHATNKIQIKKDKKGKNDRNNPTPDKNTIEIDAIRDDEDVSTDNNRNNVRGIYLDIKK